MLLDDKAPVVSNDRYVYENRVKGKRYRVWVSMRTVDPPWRKVVFPGKPVRKGKGGA